MVVVGDEGLDLCLQIRGQRYAPLDQISARNVADLTQFCSYGAPTQGNVAHLRVPSDKSSGRQSTTTRMSPSDRSMTLFVTFDKSVSYAIVNAGGFLAVTKYDVTVPVSQLKLIDGKLVLSGATREALKDVPPFEYAK